MRLELCNQTASGAPRAPERYVTMGENLPTSVKAAGRALCWVLWTLLSAVLFALSLGAIKLWRKEVNKGALRRLWRFLHPFLTSKESVAVVMPSGIHIGKLVVPLPFGGTTLGYVPEWCPRWAIFLTITFGTWYVNHLALEVNDLRGSFMDSITERDPQRFYGVLKEFGTILAVFCLISPVYVQMKRGFALQFMRSVTRQIMRLYLAHGNHYPLSLLGKPDNPNVRIWDNVREMCSRFVELFFNFIDSGMVLCMFSLELWEIESQLNFKMTLSDQSVVLPHLLMSSLLLYALFGTNCSVRVGHKLVQARSDQARLGGYFRVGLVFVEKFAEPIAVYRSEERELEKLTKRYEDALANSFLILKLQRNLLFFTESYDRLAAILPYAVLAPFFFEGQIPFGSISRSVGDCEQILAALSLIVANYDEISELLMSIDRVGELYESLLAVEADRKVSRPRISRSEGTLAGDRLVSVRDMTLYTPGGVQPIFYGLNLDVRRGERVLVTGPSGCGKSSMMHAIEGLPMWDWGSGFVETVDWSRIAGLAQLVYTVEGDMREQLLYQCEHGVQDDELLAILHRVGLGSWLDGVVEQTLVESIAGWTQLGEEEKSIRLGAARGLWNALSEEERNRRLLALRINWDTMSGGEKQRLVIARVLVKKPDLILADECTSGLDDEMALAVYKIISQAGIAILSVAHNLALLKHTDRVLEFDGLGNWKVSTAAEFEKRRTV